MKDKLLKLIKMFETFSIEELSHILECDKNDIIPYIKDFVKDNTISKIQKNKYAYLPPIKKTKTSHNRKIDKIFNAEYLNTITSYSQINPNLLFYDDDNITFYKQAYPSMRERIIKYLKLFDKTYNMSLEEVEIFLKNLKEKYPPLRYKVSTTIKLRDNFMKFGLRVFDTKAVHQKNYIPDDIYSAFKELYLYSNRYSLLGAYNELSKMSFDNRLIPCYKVFSERLREDYSIAEIKRLRSQECISPILNDSSFKIINKYTTSTESTKLFKDTAIEFLESLTGKSEERYKKHKSYIDMHLTPFFGEYTWNKITKSKIVEFIKYKNKTCNYKYQTIRGFIYTLLGIKRTIVDKKKEIKKQEHLSIQEIKNLRNNIPKLWVISTGFNESELLGLRYEDINYEEQAITLRYIYIDCTLHKLVRFTLHKKIYIPTILFEKLPKNMTGRIFENVKINNYEILINTFVYLCLQKNVPHILIAKQLGYETIKKFHEDYKSLIPKESHIDLLEGII